MLLDHFEVSIIIIALDFTDQLMTCFGWKLLTASMVILIAFTKIIDLMAYLGILNFKILGHLAVAD